MSLTAREWLLLPKEEQEHRKSELSKEECAKLRLELDMIHFTEDEKKNMSQEKREAFFTQESIQKKRVKLSINNAKRYLNGCKKRQNRNKNTTSR